MVFEGTFTRLATTICLLIDRFLLGLQLSTAFHKIPELPNVTLCLHTRRRKIGDWAEGFSIDAKVN